MLLAHQLATLDQIAEGRVILGVVIASDVANIRAEFEACGVPWEKRVGRMLEGLRLCRALWTGEPVDWDGRWTLRGPVCGPVRGLVLGPVPHRPGGPPIWLAGSAPATIERVGRHFNGWFPNGHDPAGFAVTWGEMRAVAREAGRDPAVLTGAVYLTLAIDEDQTRAETRTDAFMGSYCGQRPDVMRKRQRCYAGGLAGARALIAEYVAAGAGHLVLRFAGEHERHLELLASLNA